MDFRNKQELKIQYKLLFRLNISHDYYPDEVCPDFSFEPTRDCKRLLSRYRLVLKTMINGLQVIAPFQPPSEMDSLEKPFIEFDQDLTLSFYARLNNPNFMNYSVIPQPPSTNPNKILENSKILSFNNIDLNDSLEQHDLYTAWKDKPFDKNNNTFALVDIHINSSKTLNITVGREYFIKFEAKRQVWKYYLVLPSSRKEVNFSIEDKGNSISTQKVTFTHSKVNEADGMLAILQKQFPGAEFCLFKSEQEVACQKIGRKGLQLIQKKQGDNSPKILIEHLPNPPNHSGIQIINLFA